MAKLKRPLPPKVKLGNISSRKWGKLKAVPNAEPNPFSTFCVRRFTIFWTDLDGVNFFTLGFGAVLVNENGFIIRRSNFNRRGQVCFNLFFPIQQDLTLLVFRLSDGVIFRERFIPFGTSSFTVIG